MWLYSVTVDIITHRAMPFCANVHQLQIDSIMYAHSVGGTTVRSHAVHLRDTQNASYQTRNSKLDLKLLAV